MGASYLAIDQGGQSSRAMLFDADGRALARAQRRVGEHRPRAGWVEQDPEELVRSIRESVDEVLAAPGTPPRAAGLATQRSSLVCWDRTSGAPLSPVLSWQDRRAHAWLEQFAGHADRVHQRTGLYLSAHYGVSKLRWCLEHLPEVARARDEGRLVCGPLASFLAARLVDDGAPRADPANAGRTLLWNLREQDWDPELLDLFGVPREVLPASGPTRLDLGPLSGAAVALTVVNGDQSSALFAHGAPRRDTAFVNLGTGAFVQAVVDAVPAALPRVLAGVVYSDGERTCYVVEGTVNGAASALRRVADEVGAEGYAEALHEWLRGPADPPLFLNGVSGLGSPFWVPDFPTQFVGAGDARQRMVAVAESIAFLIQANLEVLHTIRPPFSRMLVTGGLSWYDGLCSRLASLSGLTVERPAEFEATARGTAFLVAGLPDDWSAGAIESRFEPVHDARLSERFARWRRELTRVLHGPAAPPG